MATANPASATTPATRLLPKAVGAAAGFEVLLCVPELLAGRDEAPELEEAEREPDELTEGRPDDALSRVMNN